MPYARKRAATRDALLDAGAALLHGGALRRGLAHALGPGAVTRRAGRSRQTWYRYWGDGAEAFVAELAARCLGEIAAAEAPIMDEAHGLPRGDPDTVTERIRSLGAAGFDLHARPESMLPLLVSLALVLEHDVLADGAGGEAHVRAALRDYYRGEHALGVLALDDLFASWGRRSAPPLGTPDLVAVLSALGEGIALRHHLQPDVYHARLFADALVLLLPSLSVPVRPAPDHSEPRHPAPARSPAAVARRARSNADVVTAARAEFAAQGYQQTTIAAISAASGVSETTIFEHFGSKAGVAAACFAPAIGGLEEVLATEADRPVLERIESHLRRTSELLHRSLVFVAAWLDVNALDAPGQPTDERDPRLVAPVQRPLVPLVEEAQAEGILGSELPAEQLAGGIMILMVSRVFGYPYEDPDDTYRAVELLALRGARRDAPAAVAAT